MALIDVLAKHQGVLQYVANAIAVDPMADVEHMATLLRDTGVMATFGGVLSAQPGKALGHMDRCTEMQRDGVRMVPQVSPRPQELLINWDGSMLMMVMPDTWGQFVKARGDDKHRMLTDQAWRAAARAEYDQLAPHAPLRSTGTIRLIETVPGQESWVGHSLKELVDARPGHVSDVLADWVLENDLKPGVTVACGNNNADEVGSLLAHSAGMLGNSDAGAHVQMMCASGDSTLYLQRHVRERGDVTLETGIHQLTGRAASLFGLADRGYVASGLVADLAIFSLDELHWELPEYTYDLPNGARRFTRPEGGYRYTICRGEVTQQEGKLTENRPGSFAS
jgi:N-acyl-D-aspartate/D-glutamate deacylase